MKRSPVQLTDRQLLALAILLVILIAISLLYCVGLGSLALQQAWKNTPLPSEVVRPTEATGEGTPALLPAQSPLPPATAP